MNPYPTSNRNNTIQLASTEKYRLAKKILFLEGKTTKKNLDNKIICGDNFNLLDFFPNHFISLVFADPPYNINKKFDSLIFKKMDIKSYKDWCRKWIVKLIPKLTSKASLYVCRDWRSSSTLYKILNDYFIVQNLITFEREKGRGVEKNYKNCSEDIFFCTNSKNYTFHLDKIKLRKKGTSSL